MKIMPYCPNCGKHGLKNDQIKKYHCPECQFTFYANVAAAVAGIVLYEKKIILITRKKEPQVGKLDLPGGFVDPDETAEEALRRESKEELGLDLKELRFFRTETNIYPYKGFNYRTLDIYFLAKVDTPPKIVDTDEVQDVRLLNIREVDFSELAFESARKALKEYRTSLV